MKVVAFAGGTGSAKLLRGLYQLPLDLAVVANVGDNFWAYGAYICPDVDIACYTLAGIADGTKGWGIAGDTFATLDQLARVGAETWFRMGDRDLAVSLARTGMMREGANLTAATERLAEALGVRCRVLPASDDSVETRILTKKGDLHLQEFWVREKGRPEVSRIHYRGARTARTTTAVESAVAEADRIIVCPANPITSIMPMLAMQGFSRMVARTDARVVALSPMVGSAPFSGPAGKLMQATGTRQDSAGVAKLYSKFLDCLLISDEDSSLAARVESYGVACVATDTRLENPRDEVRLAKELLRA